MCKKKHCGPRSRLSVAPLLGAGVLAVTAPTWAADGFTGALTGGKPSADLRLRYEGVDQANIAEDARATTLRLRLGYETGTWQGFSALVEAENVTALGGERYNSTVNGKTNFPVVADPEATEINQAYLGYAGLPGTRLKYGRQRITLDNHRFIGNVGWRQNEQTFDAFTVSNVSLPHTNITAGYIFNVNRVFSDKHPQGDFKMKSPIFNINYKGWSVGEVVAYGYLLDFTDVAASSAQTYGLRLKGSAPLGGVKALYAAEYATQRDYRDNPRDFSLKYYLLEAGVGLSAAEFKLGYEVLGGNGTVAVQTPLATLHAMNGWADQFLTTPATGLKDAYVSAATTVLGTRLEAIYHDFRADSGSARYGTEWNLQAVKAIDKTYSVGAKYASYNAKSFSVDTDKFWLWAEAKF
ncbi:MAG: alginate export family protein [Pseudomonadota bacterium]